MSKPSDSSTQELEASSSTRTMPEQQDLNFANSKPLCRHITWMDVKTCVKAENDKAKSGNDEAKGVPGRRGVTEGDRTM